MAFGLLLGLSRQTTYLLMIQQVTRHPEVSHVNTHKMVTAAEDFMNRMYKIAFMWIPVSLLLQLPFSMPSGFMNKMIVVADIEIVHGCSNHGLCVV